MVWSTYASTRVDVDASRITKLIQVSEGTPELVVVVLLIDTKHIIGFFFSTNRLAFSLSGV